MEQVQEQIVRFFWSWVTCFQLVYRDLVRCVADLPDLGHCRDAYWALEDYFKHWIHEISSGIIHVFGVRMTMIFSLLAFVLVTIGFRRGDNRKASPQ